MVSHFPAISDIVISYYAGSRPCGRFTLSLRSSSVMYSVQNTVFIVPLCPKPQSKQKAFLPAVQTAAASFSYDTFTSGYRNLFNQLLDGLTIGLACGTDTAGKRLLVEVPLTWHRCKWGLVSFILNPESDKIKNVHIARTPHA